MAQFRKKNNSSSPVYTLGYSKALKAVPTLNIYATQGSLGGSLQALFGN